MKSHSVNLKSSFTLLIIMLLTACSYCQRHTVRKICEIQKGQKLQGNYGWIRPNDIFGKSPESKILFALEEGSNYIVWINNEQLGAFPKELGFQPKLDINGNLFLPIKIDSNYFLKVNERKYGPFENVKDAYFQNDRLVILCEKYETSKGYFYEWYVDGSFIFSGPIRSKICIDRQKKILSVRPSKEGQFNDIYVGHKLLESDKRIPNFQLSGKNSYLYFHENGKESPLYYYVNGKKYGPIDGYWAPGFDQFDNFIGKHEIDSLWYVQFNDELHGPYTKNPQKLIALSSKNGILISSPNIKDETKFDIYWNGKHIANYDGLVPLINFNYEHERADDCYYYLENGIHKLGYEGRELGRSDSKIFEAYKKGGYFIYRDEKHQVYLNGIKYKIYKEAYNLRIGEKGQFIFIFRDESGYGVNLNGNEYFFDAKYHPAVIASSNFDHFLAFDKFSLPTFMIDDQLFPYIKGKTEFFYNEYSNSFHWIQVVGNEVFWHTYTFD